MSEPVSGVLIITNMFNKPVNAGNVMLGLRNPDGTLNVNGTVIGIAQTIHSAFDFANMGSATTFADKWLPGIGGAIGVAAAIDNFNNARSDYNDNKPVQQADLAGMLGGAASFAAGGAIVIFGAAAAAPVVVPLALFGLGAGAWQLAAKAEGWQLDPAGYPVLRALTDAEKAQVQATLAAASTNDTFDSAVSTYLDGAHLAPVDGALWDHPEAFAQSPLQQSIDQAISDALDLARQAGEAASSAIDRIGQSLQKMAPWLSEATSLTYAQINATVATTFSATQTAAPARRDPLILDLDNDGLETTGINTATPILFDHTGTGVKTATGWVKPDDAFLVLDRNGNNTIDSGQELFGDSTPLSTGGTAIDGFGALAQEDTNHDGLVNASDARFASLRLWRDLNQDGISQSNELFTLASQGIAALNVTKTSNSTFLANGNQLADLGGFVRSDGSNGTLGAVEQLADVNLANNPFYSQFTDTIPLTEQAQALADMQGAGMVRNLREAASLQTTQGNTLASALATYGTATTRSGQLAQLDSLLKAWSDTSSMATTASDAFAGVNLSVTFAGVTTGTPAWQAWMDKLSILERFNGQTFMPVPAAGATLAIDFYSTRETLLDAAYTALKDSVYGALVMQTRLKPYLDQIGLSIGESGITLDFSAMESSLETRRGADAINGFVDRIELMKYAGSQILNGGWDGAQKLDDWIAQAETEGAWASVRAGLEANGIHFGSTTKGVSFAFFLEQPCHVAHALTLPECRSTLFNAESIGSPVFLPRRIITFTSTGWRNRLPIGTATFTPMHS